MKKRKKSKSNPEWEMTKVKIETIPQKKPQNNWQVI